MPNAATVRAGACVRVLPATAAGAGISANAMLAIARSAACMRLTAVAGERIAARLARLHVLPLGCAVAGSAQRVVAIAVARVVLQIGVGRAAMMNPLHALARA